MAGYEQTIVVGNVGRDPELRYTQSGAAVTGFSVAVTTRWTDRQTNERREKTNWYSVSCWGRLAEVANQYVRKGTQIMVVGTVTARAWSDQGGESRASLDLRADNFQLLGSRNDNMDNGGGSNYNYDDDYNAPPPQNIDDIPF
ncbi:single-stranded DNA-binding protein [Phototrophicus methaneseepsis]|uniref:Single-stranded DNA-binding protein n=1 Tax=Phototrophicus methaneseepsis TaxID=2710758 RepID=A0A7S8E8G7_9CHLR|nr:single-stranded DNA-binding protein [Phototrophicus methaneseepsis]QPC82323.1 single-stranded DNA-binding protein [Phototrophicus methaneseepsis]